MKNNLVSIIVIVKDDKGVDLTLRSLLTIQRSSNSEIIIVDSSDGKLDYIKEKYPKFKWIPFHISSHKKITIPEQRNVGINYAKGNIIVFIDAGCIPEENWLEILISPITSGQENIVAGCVYSLNSPSFRDETVRLNRNKTYLEEAPTINIAINKSVFKEVGTFDESFEYGSDVDFTWRCRDLSYRILYEQNAVIRHNWGQTKQEVIRSFRYGKARAKLYRKFPKRILYAVSQDPISIIYPFFLLLLPFTFYIPFFPLVLLIPLIKNIHKKPFATLMDHLIRGYGILYGLIT